MTDSATEGMARLRLDKWLWAARLYKTRALAAEAVDAGHVRVNGQTVKPARELRVGDMLEIIARGSTTSMEVRGINSFRRPAVEARELYAETAESIARRATEAESRRLAPAPGSDLKGRPTKKARRQIGAFGRD